VSKVHSSAISIQLAFDQSSAYLFAYPLYPIHHNHQSDLHILLLAWTSHYSYWSLLSTVSDACLLPFNKTCDHHSPPLNQRVFTAFDKHTATHLSSLPPLFQCSLFSTTLCLRSPTFTNLDPLTK
jgi:hypothetical protein